MTANNGSDKCFFRAKIKNCKKLKHNFGRKTEYYAKERRRKNTSKFRIESKGRIKKWIMQKQKEKLN